MRIIKFPELVHGRLIKRYKRFLADISLDNGEVVTAHCTNSGTMKSCLEENAEVFLTPVNDPKRKTKFTWEMILINNSWVGINTGIPNQLVYKAINQGLLKGFEQYTEAKREVTFGDSRLDVKAWNMNEQCYIEVKNVTLKEGKNALFPDAVTTRGKKHLHTLMDIKQAGHRAVMVYVVQRTDIEKFGPAKSIDPEYTSSLIEAQKKGVEILPIMVNVNPKGIKIAKYLDFEL